MFFFNVEELSSSTRTFNDSYGLNINGVYASMLFRKQANVKSSEDIEDEIIEDGIIDQGKYILCVVLLCFYMCNLT